MGVRQIAGLLESARQSKFSRGVQRVQFQRALKGVDRLRKLPVLRIDGTQKIPSIGVVGIDLGDMAESVNGGRGVRIVFEKQPQVVPGVWILAIRFDGRLQNLFGLVRAP